MSKKIYLVWNDDKSECVGFKSIFDAKIAATGSDGVFGNSQLAETFYDLYAIENDLEIEEVEI
ncbi:hypothetical protein DKL61_09240 [Gammaproteobacteria bacterium ESL0073]|nr:hypothetical protein DKL61_09240 [Gammaproteobacteria bacterium ESL0073]